MIKDYFFNRRAGLILKAMEISYYHEFDIDIPVHVNALLAKRFHLKKLQNFAHRVFIEWRRWVFSLHFTRDLIVSQHLLMTLMSKIVRRWQLITKISAKLGKCVRRHWKRKKTHSFALWKCSTNINRRKFLLQLETFTALRSAHFLRQRVAAKWVYFRIGLAALIVQRFFIRLSYRRRFSAMKTIKYFLLRKKGVKILKFRKREELHRQNSENETVDILVRRARNCYEDFVKSDNPRVRDLLEDYFSALNNILQDPKMEQKVFPTISELPELATLWTLKSKGLSVLKQQCDDTVKFYGIKRFRLSYPPPYQCYRCFKTFTLRKECYDHGRNRCTVLMYKGVRSNEPHIYDIGISNGSSRVYSKYFTLSTRLSYPMTKPDYMCGILAQPLVERILQPLTPYIMMKD